MRRLLPLIAIAALASCERAPVNKVEGGAFIGLVRSQAAFTFSPDRCVLSMLFDNFRVQPPKQKGESSFELVGGNGGNVKLIVKGALIGTGTGGKLAVTIGTGRMEQDLPDAGDEPFTLEFAGTMPAEGTTPVKLEASIPEKAELDLTIDSVDMPLSGVDGCGVAAT